MLTTRAQNWILLCIGMILLHTLTVWGQQDRQRTNVTVYESVSPGTVEGALRRMNIQFQRVGTAQSGAVEIKLVLMTMNVLLTLKPDGSRLELAAGILDSRPEWAAVNKWNQEVAHTYAFTTDKGYVLASELDLQGGVTLRAIEIFIERFGVNLVQFRAVISTYRGRI